MKLCCTAVLMVLLVGCGTASRVVRLETGRTGTLVFTPPSGAEAVELNDEALKEAMAKLARDARPPARAQEAARQLFELETRSGSYTYEIPSHRITPLEPSAHLAQEATTAEVELTHSYLRWCERTGRPGDCLRLLTESPTVNEAKTVLEAATKEGGVAAIGAIMTLRRWEEGTWALDPG